MTWLAKIGALFMMLFGGIFGFSYALQTAPASVPISVPQSQQQTLASQSSSGSASSATSSLGGTPDIQNLMEQIGCTDFASCESACMRTGMTSTCNDLRALMSAEQSGYGKGSPSAAGHDVAFVGNNTSANAGALPACPADLGFFNALPMRIADLSGIEPLGHMNGEHVLPNQADHVYLIGSTGMASTPVFAPGNATLFAIVRSVGIAGADKGTGTVKLYFSPCKSVMFAFQINTLAPQLENALSGLHPAAVQAGAAAQNTTYGDLNIPLASGEELGTVTAMGSQGGQADFAAADVRTAPLQFIDQNEATGMLADSYAHAVCPLDYFSASLKDALYGKLTIVHAGVNGIPACGAVMQDKAGTAQGNWYRKSDVAPAYQGINESALLAIVHSNLDPAKGVISVGTDLVQSPYLGTQIIFSPTSSGAVNREPSQIIPSDHIYCFDGPAGAGGHGAEGHIDIRLDSAMRLEADYGAGPCAARPVLTNAVIYER